MWTFQPRLLATPSVSTCMRTKVEHWAAFVKALVVKTRCFARSKLAFVDVQPMALASTTSPSYLDVRQLLLETEMLKRFGSHAFEQIDTGG
jgi:hypothetical protein